MLRSAAVGRKLPFHTAAGLTRSRVPNASETWLARHEVTYDDLIFVEKYGHAPGGVPLVSILDRDYAWVVEDSFDMAARLARAGQRVRLLDRPWNRLAVEANVDLVRCADWSEVLRSVPI